jgi:serine/threonine-protein kinase ATR
VSPTTQPLIVDAERFSFNLLKLADEPIPDKAKQLELSSFPYMRSVFPSEMMMPLQDLLTGTLPSHADTDKERMKAHNPFPMNPVTIKSLDPTIDVMSSLVKPKKLVFIGTDGKKYPFLCKPKDDLRKDARLMDFNAMINKLLKSASESRRRQLCEYCTVSRVDIGTAGCDETDDVDIRTYAVMPLNELCGLIEWVSNTLPLKVILEDQYKRKSGKKLYVSLLPHTR